ncbi:O-antigen polymerase [uncultured Clostridium sp.]|jgi:hypothetical protein|uniref:O-antigen polymerase n=1 Tax=uncultured Clostridium sp. TaxID=59620 RepID=UPI0026018C1D|nr:O-antigen polymerase [uncultured Clostridium sp.]
MNPFIIYILAFGSALGLYIFNWSNLYPELTFSLVFFLGVSSLICGYISLKMSKENKFEYKDIKKNRIGDIALAINSLLFVADFIYAGYIPMFDMKKYLEFSGIPMVHVFIYTFNIFLGIYLFHIFISEKTIKNFLKYTITFLPAFLLVSRGMIMNIVIGSGIIFILKYGKWEFYKKNFIKLIIVCLVGLFGFGVYGNIRNNSINGANNKLDSSYIMSVGGAREEFKKSIIPKEYFWGYLYISSPLANLQNTIIEHKPKINGGNFYKFLSNEVTIDFIAKRVFKNYEKNKSEKKIPLITPHLTVSTVYTGAYYYLGWLGVWLMFAILIGGSYLYMNFISDDNPLRVIAIAMLCNLVALCAFSNMVNFSGMSFQLIFPILLEIYLKVKRSKSEN